MATLTVTLTDAILDAMDDDAILALRPALIGEWDAERTVRYLDIEDKPVTDRVRARAVGPWILLWSPNSSEDSIDATEAVDNDGNMAGHLREYAERYAERVGFGEV